MHLTSIRHRHFATNVMLAMQIVLVKFCFVDSPESQDNKPVFTYILNVLTLNLSHGTGRKSGSSPFVRLCLCEIGRVEHLQAQTCKIKCLIKLKHLF